MTFEREQDNDFDMYTANINFPVPRGSPISFFYIPIDGTTRTESEDAEREQGNNAN